MKNEIKTILFASLIAAMILPFSGMQFAEADKQITEYTRYEVDRVFSLAGDHVIITANNKIKLDRQAMLSNGMTLDEVKIVKKYAKLNNAYINALISEDEESIETAKNNLTYGIFKQVFNDPVANNLELQNGVSIQGWFDSSACGITNGNTSTYPQTPALYVGTDGHANESAIETWLQNNGQHIVYWPAADWGDLVYAEKNFTGQEECDNGEFRDEWNVYDATPARYVNGEWTSGWYTLNHDNEPNPETLSYSSPTYWWNGFVVYWHDNY